MSKDETTKPQAELSSDELEQQEGRPLPDREAMTAVSLDLGPPPLDDAWPVDDPKPTYGGEADEPRPEQL